MTSYYLLLTSYSLLLTSYSLLLTSYFLLLTPYFLLLTTFFFIYSFEISNSFLAIKQLDIVLAYSSFVVRYVL